ncbi:MAG: hypothetical protein FGM37_11085, partial [Phycisphaerales bacterium]|nr:hypothetical protein [Phycisphaerales bacterium]
MSAAHSSFVERADEASGWGLSNLPLGVFGAEGRGRRIGVRIGDSVLDLHACAERGVLGRLDPAVRESLTREQYLSAGHVVASYGSDGARNLPVLEGWFLEREGISRRIEVTAPTMAALPGLVVGTQR